MFGLEPAFMPAHGPLLPLGCSSHRPGGVVSIPASFNVDATLTIIEGAEAAVIEALWSAANSDAPDHAECDNGGAYALWALPGDQLVLGGFDNGGSDIAQTEVALIVQRLGTVVAEVSAAHFDPAQFLDNGKRSDPQARMVLNLPQALEPQPTGRRRARPTP